MKYLTAILLLALTALPLNAHAGLIWLTDGKYADYETVTDLGDKVELTTQFGRKHVYEKVKIDFAKTLGELKKDTADSQKKLAEFREDLDVQDYVLDSSFMGGTKWRLNGTVRNISKGPVTEVRVQAKLYSTNGSFITIADAEVNPTDLLPGQFGVFSIPMDPKPGLDPAKTLFYTYHK